MACRVCLPLAWLALLSVPAVQAAPDDGRIRDELREIYEREEFKPPRSEPSPFAEALRRVFDWLGGLRQSAPGAFWLLLLICAGLLVLLLVFLGTVIRRSAYVRGESDDGAHLDARRRQLSASLRAEAEQHARAGDFTAAVRCLFLSLVYAFDESGRLHFEPALTNREYLHSFVRRPAVEPGLRVFVDVLDANWYGQQSTTASRYQECLALYEKLRRL